MILFRQPLINGGDADKRNNTSRYWSETKVSLSDKEPGIMVHSDIGPFSL